jgi:hypothetical protein
MDPTTEGAAGLLTALHEAAHRFSDFGYTQFLAHQSVPWKQIHSVGRGVAPLAVVGVAFDLRDDDNTEVVLSVSVGFRDNHFEIEGDATFDDPLPTPGGDGNQRFLVDFPTVRTTDLDECLAALHDYTNRLCAYESVLDDLDLPRTAGA